jgi:hypothetical protein
MQADKKQRKSLLPIAAGAVFVLCTAMGHGASADWVTVTDTRSPSANIYLAGRWNPEAGMQLRMANTNTKQQVTLTLHREKGHIEITPRDSFPPSVERGVQFNPEVLPPSPIDSVEVIIKLRAETWAVYVGDRPAVILPTPMPLPLRCDQDSGSALAESDRDVYVQKVADFRFADAFLIPENEENPLAAWNIESGTWELHTAADNAIARKNIKEDAEKRPMPERSPNFYSLAATGTNAVITAGHDFYDAYSAEAAVLVEPGERGLVFLYSGKENYLTYTLTMRPEWQEAVLAVHRVTTAQDSIGRILKAVAVPMTSGQWVKLKVRLYQNRIQCFLDENLVMDFATELPIGGRFGLFANAPAPSRFDDVEASSNHNLDFKGVDLLRRYALEEEGQFLPRRRFFGLFGAPRLTEHLSPPRSRKDQWLMIGSPQHGPHVFSAEFTMEKPETSVGIITGYQDANAPYYRFIRETSPTNERFRIERIAKA